MSHSAMSIADMAEYITGPAFSPQKVVRKKVSQIHSICMGSMPIKVGARSLIIA